MRTFILILCISVHCVFGWGLFSSPKQTIMASPPTEERNMAKVILDLHNKNEVFDFCGGMMFQLVLSDKLRDDLMNAAANPPAVFDASVRRMAQIPDYSQCNFADNTVIFHGREVRKAPAAAGGMGMVLQLVSAKEDPEGWSAEELREYNGWGHDSGRKWRNAAEHSGEGNSLYQVKFGSTAFGLHHRFYWHLDKNNGLWLSAEDGCEGVLRKW